jgi:hypothetical protein
LEIDRSVDSGEKKLLKAARKTVVTGKKMLSRTGEKRFFFMKSGAVRFLE